MHYLRILPNYLVGRDPLAKSVYKLESRVEVFSLSGPRLRTLDAALPSVVWLSGCVVFAASG